MRKLFHWYKNSYAGLPTSVWLMATIQLVAATGTMVLSFLSIYLSQRLNVSTSETGLVVSSYGIGMLIGTWAGGYLTDRIGAFRVQQVSLLGSAVLLISLSFVHSLTQMCVGSFFWGICAASLMPANSAAMAFLCPEKVRTKGFVLNRLVNNLGATIGPVIGGVLAKFDYQYLFWIDGALCGIAGITLLWYFPKSQPSSIEPKSPVTRATTFWWNDKVFSVILISTLMVGFMVAQIFSTFGLYLKEACHLTELEIGFLFALNTIVIVAFQMPLTQFLERFHLAIVSALGGILVGIGFGLVPFGFGMTFLAFTVLVWTLGEMLVWPSLTTMISLRAPKDAQGRFQGMYGLSISIGMIIGPSLGSHLYAKYGGMTLWLVVGSMGIIAFASLFYLNSIWDGKRSCQNFE